MSSEEQPSVIEVHDKSCPNYDFKTKVEARSFMYRSKMTKVEYSETCAWGNSILSVLFNAWKDSNPFKKLVLDEIYIAVNMGRPAFLSEVKFVKMTLEGEPPKLLTVALCPPEVYQEEGLQPDRDFFIEGDVDFPGKVTFQVKLGVKINWPLPAFVEIPVTLNIAVSMLRGRVRLCFTNHEKSFLQFVRSPQVTVAVDPVLGHQDDKTLNLSSIPKVTGIIRDVINKEIADLVYPKKLVIPVPVTNEPVKIDKDGNVIARGPF